MSEAKRVGAVASTERVNCADSSLPELLATAGSKGGGSKTFAQGAVTDPSAIDAVLARAVEWLCE